MPLRSLNNGTHAGPEFYVITRGPTLTNSGRDWRNRKALKIVSSFTSLWPDSDTPFED